MSSESIIQSLQIDVQVSSPAGDGAGVEREVLLWKDNHLLPVLDSWIHELDHAQIHLRLDRLEIEVFSSSTNWQEDVLRQLHQKLISKISEQQASAPMPWLLAKNSAQQITKSFVSNDKPNRFVTDQKHQNNLEPATQHLDSDKSSDDASSLPVTEELIIYVLQHGVLPWWSQQQTIHSIREAIDEWIQKNEIAGSTWLVFNTARLRTTKLFAGSLLLKLFDKYHTAGTQQLKADYQIANDQIALGKQTATFKQYIENVFLNLPAFNDANSFINSINKAASQPFINYDNLVKADGQQNNLITPFDKITDESNKQHAPELKEYQRKGKEHYAKSSDEAIFITNAGAVLFAPFLPALFTKLGLVQEGRLKDINSCISLIHFVATGVNDAGEFELVLPKIFCGLHPEDPAFYVPLTDIQQAEVTNLLDSVISYWSALRNTSQQTLRETFFCRKGKLYWQGGNWQLLVEHNALDILLQSVSWNFSMLKFSWMPWMLSTEWNY